ncbi:MAG: hypothetical protein IH869_05155 [Chloroflexi bacterium]|nr:hypothetical protein [Chloroflexota bacterium]
MIRAGVLLNRKVVLVWLAAMLLAGLAMATVMVRADSHGTTYTFGDFVVEDGKFELRMGDTAYFGYEAEQRIPTIPGLIEIVFGPIQVGDTISFARCRQSGSRSTVTHHLTVDALGIDYVLDDGRFGADPPGGAVGDSDDPSNNCEFTFDAPGEYLIYDSTDPDGHGVARIIVEAGPPPPPPEPTGLETVVVNPIKVDFESLKSRSKQEVWIYGSGFAPNVELNLFVSLNGVLYDINPQPKRDRRDGGGSVWPLVTNQFGTFATNWRLGRITRRNVGDESMATVLITDAAFNDLATTPIALCNTSGRADFAEANPDAVEVTLGGLAEAIADAIEADPTAKIAFHDGGGLRSVAKDAAIANESDTVIVRNFATVTDGFDNLAVVSHFDDFNTGSLDGVVPDIIMITVPEWCSASPVGDRDRIRSSI